MDEPKIMVDFCIPTFYNMKTNIMNYMYKDILPYIFFAIPGCIEKFRFILKSQERKKGIIKLHYELYPEIHLLEQHLKFTEFK